VLGANEYVVWNTDGNGDYTSAATGIFAGTSSELEAVEASFGEDFAGSPEPTPTTIATNGTTTLAQVGNLFELNPARGGTGSLLELNGSAVTKGQFPAGWTPVGALQTGDGYEVAWSVPGSNEYVVWNTESNGDYTSAATGILSGANPTLEAAEANFGDGTFPGAGTPASATMIATNGTTTLAQVGNLFELNPARGGPGPLLELTGPMLELNGSVVTAASSRPAGRQSGRKRPRTGTRSPGACPARTNMWSGTLTATATSRAARRG
jgi:serralysin